MAMAIVPHLTEVIHAIAHAAMCRQVDLVTLLELLQCRLSIIRSATG
jgi:hypothetical protein